MFEPKPVQRPGPRLHIGGDGPAALRRAATVGDGWAPMNHPLEEVPGSVARIAELRAAAGRDGRTEVTLGGDVATPDDVERYAAAGVDRLFVRPWKRSAEAVDAIGAFASTFIA